MKISVTNNIRQATQGLAARWLRQVLFAADKASTATAQAVAGAERREIRDVFDRPTPNTMSAIYVRPATKQGHVAEVGIKDFAGKGIAASKYLAAQIRGGSRQMKRFERALQAVGALPPGYRAVPGAAAKMDAYGNMLGGQIVQILSYFKAFPEAGYRANMTDKRRAALAKGNKKRLGYAYFVGRPGANSLNFPLGIWQRFQFAHGSAVRPVLIFVPSVAYEAIFDFYYVARKTAEKEFDPQFVKALVEAIRTAR